MPTTKLSTYARLVLCALLAASFATAQKMPREDVVDVPAISDGLCVSNLFQSNMVLQRDKPVAIWGWAGLIVHGMLHRIVPFLAWFHELSPLVGKTAVPSARGLLPDARTRLGLGLHLASLLAGSAAILTRRDQHVGRK